MAVGESFRALVNIRPVGTEQQVYDYFTIPGVSGAGSVLFRLTELALNVPLPNPHNSAIECREVDAFNVELPGPIRLTPIDQNGILTAGTFVIKSGTLDSDDSFRFGMIRFSQFDAGRRFKVIYTGRGSLVYAEDVLNLNYGLSLLPNVIKPGHISATTSDTFSFPGDVGVSGALTVSGDINVSGHLNHLLSETFTTVDSFIRLNEDFSSGSPVADGGLLIRRGSSPDVGLSWDETNDKWVLSGGPLSIPSGILVQRHDAIATPAQTVFSLPFSYNAGTNQLLVYLNGMLQAPGAGKDYQETSISLGLSSEVTFEEAVDDASRLTFLVIGA